MTSWEFLGVLFGLGVLVLWGLGEAVYQRRRIRKGISGVIDRVQRSVE